MPKKIVLIAGEVSGDKHAAELSLAIKALAPDVVLMGLGGERMQKAGVTLWDDVTNRSSIGLVESLKHVFPLRVVFNKIMERIKEEKPDVVVLVDYQGFNIQVAKALKKLKLPTLYYFAPQYWIWASWRAPNICRLVTRVLATFPQEAETYEKAGGVVSYVGHPLLDFTKSRFLSKEEARNYFGFKKSYVVGLFLGSRVQEIENHLDLVFSAARRLNMLLEHDIDFYLPLALEQFRPSIEEGMKRYDLKVKIVADKDYYEAIQASDLIYCSSGTATLEVSIMQVPLIVFYKLSYFSFFLGKLLVRFPYASLPNIVMGRRAVPEFLQSQASPEDLAKVGWEILVNEEKRNEHLQVLSEIKKRLGEPGAVNRAAAAVLQETKGQKAPILKNNTTAEKY